MFVTQSYKAVDIINKIRSKSDFDTSKVISIRVRHSLARLYKPKRIA